MKSRSSCILTYIASLAIGALLLIFSGQTDLFKIIVIIIGVLFLLPSSVAIVYSWIPAKDIDGRKVPRPWYISLSGILGLIFGILLLSMPSFFVGYIVYTLGIILILCGVLQIVYISAATSALVISKIFYIVPWITLLCGIAVIIIGPKYLSDIATILTGIFLVGYSVNGFIELLKEKKKPV